MNKARRRHRFFLNSQRFAPQISYDKLNFFIADVSCLRHAYAGFNFLKRALRLQCFILFEASVSFVKTS